MQEKGETRHPSVCCYANTRFEYLQALDPIGVAKLPVVMVSTMQIHFKLCRAKIKIRQRQILEGPLRSCSATAPLSRWR